MLKFLKKESAAARTENGAATLATSGSDCLDLFATIGALRHASENEIIKRFSRAYAENPELAMKIAFFARDVRGGLGERRSFRIILRYLSQNEQASVFKNINNIGEYGRYDDLLVLLDSPCQTAMIRFMAQQIHEDMAALQTQEASVSLLAKWLPSVNASNAETVKKAKQIARLLGMSDAQYRKTLSKLRERIALLENNLRMKDYSFDYAKQPSKAMFKYRRAFVRNDGERYSVFMRKVKSGDAKLHTGTLYPYEVIAPCFSSAMSKEDRAAIDATWSALPDYTNGEDALVVVDGSGSMYSNVNPRPASIALSLGVYFAERNKGAFANHFITFSKTPRLVKIKGADIAEKIRYCATYNEVANTDLQAVFDLLLRTAVKNRLRQRDLPKTLYIVSDMEFDSCAENASMTNFESAKRDFKRRGYCLPKVVFWNVASRNEQQPVTVNEQGVVLVSGCSPRVFSMVLKGSCSPYQFMLDTLQCERYACITA